MVKVSLDENGYTGHIIMKPHISLSWKTNVRIFVFLSIISLLIALYFWQKGIWLVLPFSGFELLLFFSAILFFFRRYYVSEIIKFKQESIEVEQCVNHDAQVWNYQRHWSKFHIEAGKHNQARIFLKSHGKKIELGAFLGQGEKAYLISILKDITQTFVNSVNYQSSK